MYSGIIKYRVYKKDVTHYRVERMSLSGGKSGEWEPVGAEYPENLTLMRCKTVVVPELIEAAKNNGTLCAWIECEGIIAGKSIPLPNVLYFNPFTVSEFMDRHTKKVIDRCRTISIAGNKLTYSI